MAASADLSEVERVVNQMGDDLYRDTSRGTELVSPPRYAGVELVTADVSRVLVRARTEPGQAGTGGRAILEAAHEAFASAGIPLAATEESGGA